MWHGSPGSSYLSMTVMTCHGVVGSHQWAFESIEVFKTLEGLRALDLGLDDLHLVSADG